MEQIFKGEKVKLRSVEPKDWEFFYQLDDMTTDFGRNTDQIWFPNSQARAKAWTESLSTTTVIDDNFRFQIESIATGDLVGTLNTHTTNARVGTFMYGIAITPFHQRKGFASEAIKLVLRYYFHEKRYQKVNAEVYAFNQPSILLQEHLGFTLEGRLRRMVYTNGQFHDALIYGMIREEFDSRYFFEAKD